MEKIRNKSFLLISWVLCALILLPVIAFADTVPWTSQLYTAYGCAGYIEDPCYYEVTRSGPPLPILAGVSFGIDGIHNTTGSGQITTTDMHVIAKQAHIDENAIGRAEFAGTYTATAPEFSFLYLISLNYGNVDAWLNVTDQTAGTVLANTILQPTVNQQSYNINTPLNHVISVNFGIEASSPALSFTNGNGTLTYATAVAPEPISSILFITGGTLLAGRRYLKRRQA